MKKTDKQLLFEKMEYLNPEFKNHPNKNVITETFNSKTQIKNRLFEMMGKIDSNFTILTENKSIKSLHEAEHDEPEQEQEATPEEEQAATELEKNAETATATEEDNQKPVVEEKIKGVSFKVIVPTYKRKLAEKNVESLKKLAKRLGIPEPEIIVGEPYQIKIADPNNKIPPPHIYEIDVYDLTLNVGGMFKLPGDHKLVAVVDNVTGGSIEIDENEPVPSEYLEVSNECNLCNQERYRGKNFIVKDMSKGEYLRLGSSCVKKYIGIDPSKYIRTLDYLNDFRLQMDEYMDVDGMFDDEGGGGRKGISETNRLVDAPKVISIVHDLIENNGYVKREWGENHYGFSQRTNDGSATADHAEEIIFNDTKFKEYPINNTYLKEFIEFGSKLEPVPPNMVRDYDGNEYDKNIGFNEYRAKIKQLVTKQNFRIRETAILASAINYFENEKKRQAKTKEMAGSVWLGNVGEKIKVPYARLDDVRTGESQYGTWYLWSFIDDNGNSLKKFGTISDKFIIDDAPEGSENLEGYNKGDVFAFIAQVKKHDTYNGLKSTMLGRLSMLK